MAPTIYLIRHGEKPPKKDGKDQDGLSAQGMTRAQGLVGVFGSTSSYNIGFIMAQQYDSDGGRERPYETVLPLSKALGLEIDTSVDRDDAKAASKLAKKWDGPGNVLICWEHSALAKVARKIGVQGYESDVPSDLAVMDDGKVEYPGDRFDLIWTVQKPYEIIESVTLEGIDVSL